MSEIVKAQIPNSSNPLEVTEDSGLTKGRLSQLARRATEATLDAKLMGELLRERVGTKKMEREAIKLLKESQRGRSGEWGSKGEQFHQRDQE